MRQFPLIAFVLNLAWTTRVMGQSHTPPPKHTNQDVPQKEDEPKEREKEVEKDPDSGRAKPPSEVPGKGDSPTDGTDAPDEGAPPENDTPSASTTLSHADAEEGTNTAQPVPPKLIRSMPIPYPTEAREKGIVGRVLLLLTIDEEGHVSQVEVVESPGYGLGAAADRAIRDFLFSPAKVDGKPRAAKIRYEYVFTLPPQESPPVNDNVPAHSASSLTPPLGTKEQAAPIQESEEAIPEETEVVVKGHSAADRKRESAEAVTVVELDRARAESADSAEVLARTQGIGVRRVGGLGSDVRFSLNGFDEDQVRFLMDGIPLDYLGYPGGFQTVPINFGERFEIYQGVLPVRFGADALGGAINIVTDQKTAGTHAAASYQAGSFQTHRVSLAARHHDEDSGWFSKAEGFYDTSRNDYLVDVEVADDVGQLTPAVVRRFHDGYRAGGGNLEVGLLNQEWAKKLLVRGFVTDYRKELQNNVVMTVPYGEVDYGALSAGGNLRYEESFARGLGGKFVVGYTHTRTDFEDKSRCVYDWFGQCIFERRVGGEIDQEPTNVSLWDNVVYARLNLEWLAAYNHALRLSVAPEYFTRTGDERIQPDPDSRDPMTAKRDVTTLVSGLEYEVNLVDRRLENVLFIKNYFQVIESEEPNTIGEFIGKTDQSLNWGLGDGLRFAFSDWARVKASYEWATRLPDPEEVFGNGVLIRDNLELQPERSHNANLTLMLDGWETRIGTLDSTLTGFLRFADDLIVALGDDRSISYQNVFGARSVGVESSLEWTSPGDYLVLGGNVTYQDFRNTSSDGAFGSFKGDRIPNRPYLFANGNVRLNVRAIATDKDEFSLGWYCRYVHEFFRGWESVGQVEYKQIVPAQFAQTIAGTYSIDGEPLDLTFSGEVQNLTNAKMYDFFGVQRPGRAVFFKTTATF